MIGTATYLLKDVKSVFDKISGFIWFFILGFGMLKVDTYLYGTVHSYSNFSTYVATFLIITIVYVLCKVVNVKERVKTVLRASAKILLPFYLIHVACGINTIYFLRKMEISPYLCVIVAYLVSFVAAIVVYNIARWIDKIVNKLYLLAKK